MHLQRGSEKRVKEIIVFFGVLFSLFFLFNFVKADCTTFLNGTQLCNIVVTEGIGVQNPQPSRDSLYNNSSSVGISVQTLVNTDYEKENLSLSTQQVSFQNIVTTNTTNFSHTIITTTSTTTTTTTNTTTEIANVEVNPWPVYGFIIFLIALGIVILWYWKVYLVKKERERKENEEPRWNE